MKIRIFDLLKQSKPNKHLEEMYFEPFIKNPNICVIQCVKLYLAQTANLRRVSDSERFVFDYTKTIHRGYKKYNCSVDKIST